MYTGAQCCNHRVYRWYVSSHRTTTSTKLWLSDFLIYNSKAVSKGLCTVHRVRGWSGGAIKKRQFCRTHLIFFSLTYTYKCLKCSLQPCLSTQMSTASLTWLSMILICPYYPYLLCAHRMPEGCRHKWHSHCPVFSCLIKNLSHEKPTLCRVWGGFTHSSSKPVLSILGSQGCPSLSWPSVGEGKAHPGQQGHKSNTHSYLWTI